MLGAGKTVPEACNLYGEGSVGAPQQSRWNFFTRFLKGCHDRADGCDDPRGKSCKEVVEMSAPRNDRDEDGRNQTAGCDEPEDGEKETEILVHGDSIPH